MPACTSTVDLNIHKNSKYLKGKEIVPNGTASTASTTKDVERLARCLHSHGAVGRVLRMLIRRTLHPEVKYSSSDLELLLLLSLAQKWEPKK